MSKSTVLTFLCFRGSFSSLWKLLQRTCHWKSFISFRCCLWLHLNYLKFLSKTSFALNSLSPRFPLLLFEIHEWEREKERKHCAAAETSLNKTQDSQWGITTTIWTFLLDQNVVPIPPSHYNVQIWVHTGAQVAYRINLISAYTCV